MWAAYTLGVVDGRGASIRAVKRMLQHAAREIRVRGAEATLEQGDPYPLVIEHSY
jgi:hypothetical protein